ncbi:MAG: DUF3443 domain-containing protein [Steroidobacteraceae bacterium]
MASVHALRFGLLGVLCVSAAACGGGGGGGGGGASGGGPPPTNNTTSVIVDAGPLNMSVNTLFTSVTVCVPGSTTSCQTIDHIQVDTGSYGLRILASVLTLTLPVETLANGNSLAECTQFVDGFSWGPVAAADIQIAGETAHSLPVQVIGDSRFTNIPAGCSGTGGTEEDTVSAFGANGILGIGPFELDCGDCDTVATHGLYYACATSCTETAVPNNLQVPNPVTHFDADNNGAIVVLPAVAAGGASDVMGSLIFGIDTQSDNASGSQTVLTVNDNAELLMTFNGQPLANSFIDSGSNGIYFNDPSIATCPAPPGDPSSQIVNFYCPTSTLNLEVSIQGMNGAMANSVTFEVGNAETMLQSSFDAFPQLAGTIPPGNAGSFDYGLPFFYGKRVAVAVQGATTTAGTGPYIAF